MIVLHGVPDVEDRLSIVMYISFDKSVTMRRENCFSPNGNHTHMRWVLRRDGEFVDYDWNRNDLAERNEMSLSYPD